MPSIQTSHLTKRFGKFTAVDKLDLNISGAKCVGFLGPNGAGKTTTLKMLTDMIFPNEGEVLLNGISVQKERKRALEDCGVLIETPEIYPSLTPREALEMISDLRGMPASERRGRIDQALAEVKMSDWADSKVGRFSKGMKQRIYIAASLVHDPEVLLLDEPSTGLDPRGMAEVRQIIRGLKKSHRLIFMSSHILSEVTDVCDEVALIDRGHLLFYDTLANVTARFNDGGASVDLAFAKPLSDDDLRTKVATAPGVRGAERLDATRVRLQLTGGLDVQEQLLANLAQMRLGLVGFQASKSALEEVYLAQVQRGD